MKIKIRNNSDPRVVGLYSAMRGFGKLTFYSKHPIRNRILLAGILVLTIRYVWSLHENWTRNFPRGMAFLMSENFLVFSFFCEHFLRCEKLQWVKRQRAFSIMLFISNFFSHLPNNFLSCLTKRLRINFHMEIVLRARCFIIIRWISLGIVWIWEIFNETFRTAAVSKSGTTRKMFYLNVTFPS